MILLLGMLCGYLGDLVTEILFVLCLIALCFDVVSEFDVLVIWG